MSWLRSTASARGLIQHQRRKRLRENDIVDNYEHSKDNQYPMSDFESINETHYEQLLLDDNDASANVQTVAVHSKQDSIFAETMFFDLGFHHEKKKTYSMMHKNPIVPCSTITSEDLLNEVDHFISDNSLTDKAGADLIRLINKLIPEQKQLLLDKNKVQSAHLSAGVYWYDCCTCGETVYADKHKHKKGCNYCERSRYRSTLSKTPRAMVNYRSILFIISELLHTNWFISALNYVQKDSKHVDIYGDVQNGSVFRKHAEEMKTNYEQKYHLRDRDNVTPISLLFGVYYDGLKVFSRKSVDFWPLMISILNLPPNLRKLFGAGIFLLSIIVAKSGSWSELFIFRERFICELDYLSKGVEITINDKKYFVQARLILHCYDTRAMEKVLNIQLANALAACPLCGLVNG